MSITECVFDVSMHDVTVYDLAQPASLYSEAHALTCACDDLLYTSKIYSTKNGSLMLTISFTTVKACNALRDGGI